MSTQTDNQAIFNKGDVAIILRPTGEVVPLNLGYDTERLRSLDVDEYTDEDHIALEQGRKLFALTFAASTPMLMDLLMQISEDPDVVDMERLGQFVRPN